MDETYKASFAKKSDAVLKNYLDNPGDYSKESVEEAIAELQRRGKVFSDTDLDIIRNPGEEDYSNTGTPKIFSGWKSRPARENIVKDESAPVYYSQRAIYTFSILFGVPFGSCMLASNLNKVGHKTPAIWIGLFGFVYFAAAIYVLQDVKITGAGFIVNGLGALLLDFFWHRYIGYKTLYRAKKIWLPLIIALVIEVPILLIIIYGRGE
jgi:hypothetical protein